MRLSMTLCVLLLCGLVLAAAMQDEEEDMLDLLDKIDEDLAMIDEMVDMPMEKRKFTTGCYYACRKISRFTGKPRGTKQECAKKCGMKAPPDMGAILKKLRG